MKIKDLSISNKGYYGIGASSTDANDNYPQYLRITDIDDRGNAPKELPKSININEYPKWEHFLLKENDIVFARTGNSTGRNFFCNKLVKNTVFAGYLIKFSLDSNLIVPRYVGYYCQSEAYWNQIKTLFTGSTRHNVNAQQYANLLIPIKNKDIQQHIVNIVRYSLCY